MAQQKRENLACSLNSRRGKRRSFNIEPNVNKIVPFMALSFGWGRGRGLREGHFSLVTGLCMKRSLLDF